MNDLIGTTIERYKILSELGHGGMAVVYRATDTMLDRNVAVKMILTETTNRDKTQKLLRRFNREAKTLAGLSHPNIVKVLDYGEHENMPYIVMEYISGGALRKILGRPIPYAEAAAMLAPIAHALQHAHRKKIVHRDVKPENILINDSNQPMLSDFGILKFVDVEESQGLTGTGKIVGTPAYMSPEQIRGREVDGRADMYSLGIVFFEMVTGRKPFNANTPIELSMQHLHDPIPKAKQFIRDLPLEVDKVIAKSIAKDPEDRYPNMAAFAQALEKLSGTTARTTTAERRAIKAAEEKQKAEKDRQGKEKQVRELSPRGYVLIAAIILVLGIPGFIFRQNIVGLVAPSTQTAVPATPTIEPTKPPPSPTAVPQSTNTTQPENTSTPVATLSPKLLRIDNVGQVVQINRMDGISVLQMDWIEDNNWLINAGTNTVSFIDAKQAQVAQKVGLDGGIPLSMAIADKRIYILLNDSIKVIDTETFKVVKTINPISGGLISIAASPDGSLLALGISDNKTQLINPEDGSVVRNLKSNYGGWSVAFSPDSQYIISGTSQGILKWKTASGIWQITNGGQNKTIKSLAFSHDGKTIVGGGEGFIYFWNVESGELIHKVEEDQYGVVSSLDFSPDDSMVVSGSADGTVRIWDAGSATLLKELLGHSSQIFGICFSPDGENIASGANEGTILLWGLP